MKKHARLYDEEMAVRALRWRRPRLVLALLGWSGAGVLCALAGVFLPGWVFYFAYGCVAMAGGGLPAPGAAAAAAGGTGPMSAPESITLGSGDEAAKLRTLLAEHQELGRLQGNRMDELARELGETQAKLRAAQGEIQRLTTLLNARGGNA